MSGDGKKLRNVEAAEDRRRRPKEDATEKAVADVFDTQGRSWEEA